MTIATIHKDRNNQTISLPPAVAFPEHIEQVEIIRVGDARILTPAGERWRVWASCPSQLTEDCLNEREQPEAQIREGFDS